MGKKKTVEDLYRLPYKTLATPGGQDTKGKGDRYSNLTFDKVLYRGRCSLPGCHSPLDKVLFMYYFPLAPTLMEFDLFSVQFQHSLR